ncbi:MAG: response regulator, partial [Desulfobulbaceae bacterium]|nr:response regulator [Desulfobulbaceae bacterium]
IFDINMLTKDQIQKDLQRAWQKQHQHFYFRHRLADGEIRDVEVYAGPITRHGEELLYSIIHDITDRKRAENAIRKSEEQWDRTFNSFADIVTLQDIDFRLVKVNQAVCDYLNVSRKEIVGRYCYELFHGAGEPCHDCPLLETKETFEPYSREMRHEKLEKTFLVSAAPVFDEQGKLEYIAHVAKDITQQKQLEAELFQAHKLEAVGTLAGGIAHDFNNILSAIIGYAEFIQMEVPPESQSGKDVRVLIEATRRATDLVKQILTFSHKSGTKKHPLRPYLIVREALKMIRATMPTSIAIEKHIDPDCGTILVNPTQLHQIIVNLCTNARQAMADEKGFLHVDLYSRELSDLALPPGHEGAGGRFVVLAVSDTGCGMDTETLNHIFEPYFTTKDKGKGTGLGLSVVHGIVQECRGFLEVESQVGRGSTLTVYLPAIDELPETEPVQEVVQGQADLVEEVRVLVVDDEPQLVRIQEERLKSRGYLVTALTDSQEALSLFREQPDRFDLLLTDQTMPVLTGADLARAVLELNPDLPIILCTGYSDTLPEKKALALGIKKYFTKPVSEAELLDAIRRLLKK